MAQKDSLQAPPSQSPSGSALLGVDLGSNHIRIGTVDQNGKVLAFRREPYTDQSREDARALADHALSVARQMAEEHGAISAVGVALPGMVNQTTNRIVGLSQLPNLAAIDLHREFAAEFRVPVHFDNNAYAAAFAEMEIGVARGVRDWLYLHIGANVSAGLVMGGQLQHGGSGLAGALGQMRIYVEHLGESIPLESMVSAENVVRRTRDRLSKDKTSSLSRLGAMGGFSYDDIIAAAHGGDELARIMLQRTGAFIAIAIADVMSLLNLSMIAVGGAPAGRSFLVPAIAEETRQRVSEIVYDDCRILAAEIGAEACVIGAALLAHRKGPTA